jgi:DNA replication initiation complex subunit (GINS family)
MLTYSTLREIQKKEFDSAAPVPLEKDFYRQLAELIAKKKKEALESGSLLSIREYENIKRIALLIYTKREEKLVLMALRGEKDTNGLSENEAALLNTITEIINNSRSKFKEIFADDTFSEVRRIRILSDVEQYVGLDKNVYGPFKAGEELTLKKEEAEWLLKAKMAELVR